ncbi:NUDIX hydrolase [Ramlibacter rhizophilus]|uniref:NUDIX hydrolase n=1 Tax=Ramlibacter rhizophilus TaxID=1781167 RepID=A0A4Z0BH07_9BURK|nr:NUDIX hydrolase [Ramlibacter rhizophilus]TFY97414.1 NUDIX hydrolase [Ramlibacter rhizophilus]
MAKSVSCGVLLLNEHGQVLLAHASGLRHWDIPKGLPDPGESPREAALRELREETGVALHPEALRELGLFAYRPVKDLHLFTAQVDASSAAAEHCRCTSFFTDRFGRQRPEVDAFRWAAPEALPSLCTPRMAGVLAQALARLDARP